MTQKKKRNIQREIQNGCNTPGCAKMPHRDTSVTKLDFGETQKDKNKRQIESVASLSVFSGQGSNQLRRKHVCVPRGLLSDINPTVDVQLLLFFYW